MSLSLQSQIESILFAKGEAMSLEALAEHTGADRQALQDALNDLEHTLAQEGSERGIRLVQTDTTAELATAPEASELIRSLNTKELTKRLGKAGLETLTIVLYQGPVSRRDIDYIRGVNSTSILRNLTIRGLIEQQESDDGTRALVYQPTTELLRHLGLSRREDLPQYNEIAGEVEQFYHEQNEPEDVSGPAEEESADVPSDQGAGETSRSNESTDSRTG
ncbi:MAG: SMC-Scp complex subunit ScpB [Candidatus Paceibacterota bacterium]